MLGSHLTAYAVGFVMGGITLLVWLVASGT